MVGKLIVIGAAAVTAVAGTAFAAWAMGGAATPGAQLMGEDYGQLRRQALQLFPRGAPVDTVQKGLTILGFRCTATRRLIPNINAPSMECDSAGRGYPTTPRMEITVMSRNGAMSDLAIGNGVDGTQADARTPDPGHRLAAPARP